MALFQQLGHLRPQCSTINGVMTVISMELTILGGVSGWVLGQLLRLGDEVLAFQMSDELGRADSERILWR